MKTQNVNNSVFFFFSVSKDKVSEVVTLEHVTVTVSNKMSSSSDWIYLFILFNFFNMPFLSGALSSC